MANFAVRLVHGPGWDPARPIGQQDGWDGHTAFMDGLVDDGFELMTSGFLRRSACGR